MKETNAYQQKYANRPTGARVGGGVRSRAPREDSGKYGETQITIVLDTG